MMPGRAIDWNTGVEPPRCLLCVRRDLETVRDLTGCVLGVTPCGIDEELESNESHLKLLKWLEHSLADRRGSCFED